MKLTNKKKLATGLQVLEFTTKKGVKKYLVTGAKNCNTINQPIKK